MKKLNEFIKDVYSVDEISRGMNVLQQLPKHNPACTDCKWDDGSLEARACHVCKNRLYDRFEPAKNTKLNP